MRAAYRFNMKRLKTKCLFFTEIITLETTFVVLDKLYSIHALLKKLMLVIFVSLATMVSCLLHCFAAQPIIIVYKINCIFLSSIILQWLYYSWFHSPEHWREYATFESAHCHRLKVFKISLKFRAAAQNRQATDPMAIRAASVAAFARPLSQSTIGLKVFEMPMWQGYYFHFSSRTFKPQAQESKFISTIVLPTHKTSVSCVDTQIGCVYTLW